MAFRATSWLVGYSSCVIGVLDALNGIVDADQNILRGCLAENEPLRTWLVVCIPEQEIFSQFAILLADKPGFFRSETAEGKQCGPFWFADQPWGRINGRLVVK